MQPSVLMKTFKNISVFATSLFLMTQIGWAQPFLQEPSGVTPEISVENVERPTSPREHWRNFLAHPSTLGPSTSGIAEFSDHFERSAIGSDWSIVQGRWGIRNGKLEHRSSSSSIGMAILNKDLASSNYEVKAKFLFTAQVSGNARGLLFRYQDADNYYYAQFNWNRRKMIFWKRVNGVQTLLAEAAAPWPAAYREQELKVRAQGDQFEFYYNDVLFLEAEDDALATGRVGVRSDLYYHHVDDFHMMTIGDPPPTVNPPGVNALPEYTNQSPLNIGGTKEAGQSIWINGVQVVPASGATTWNHEVTLTEERLYEFDVTARDAEGNESTAAPVSTTFDITPPEIVVTSSADSSTAEYVLIYEVDGDEKQRNETLVEGENDLLIVETDGAGNETRITFTVTYMISDVQVFTDDFNRNSLGPNWNVFRGRFSMLNSTLYHPNTYPFFTSAATYEHEIGDKEVEVSADFLFVTLSSSQRGLVLRYQDPDNYYYAKYSRQPSGGNRLFITKVENGVSTVLASGFAPGVANYTYAHMRFHAKDDQLTFSIGPNGEYEISVQDGTFSEGNAGVRSDMYYHAIDNFELKVFNERPPVIEDTLVPGTTIATDALMHSASIDWPLEGDKNLDATSTIRYRKVGETTWKDHLGLFRINYNEDKFSGSLLGLEPGTEYEVEITLNDPDGGGETRTLSLTTRKVPVKPTGGTIFRVRNAAELNAATRAARAGDTVLIHAGTYPQLYFDRAGAPENYIVYRPVGDGPVVFPDGLEVRASHVWVEGLIVYGDNIGEGIVIRNDSAHRDVVIIGNRVEQCLYCIRVKGLNTPPSKHYYIADNVIVGSTPAYKDTIRGEGIEIDNLGTGHTIAHNRVSNIADGISYPAAGSEVFGNDVFDTRDDGIEMDFAGSNLKIHHNRIRNSRYNSLSFQPQAGAPWYVYNNQIIGYTESPIKFRTTDRFVFAHNTIVGYTTLSGRDFSGMHQYLRSYSRNNLFLSHLGGEMYDFSPPGRETSSIDWRTDIDFNGFDWGSETRTFSYEGVYYPDLASFMRATGLEVNGVMLDKSDYTTVNFPGPDQFIPEQNVELTGTSRARDVGDVIPGINDGFQGSQPDLGAIEFGSALPHYGPRIAVPPKLGSFIFDIEVQQLGDRVTITWKTDFPARSRIDYGLDTSYGTTVTDATLKTDHSLEITGLSLATTYHFKVISEDVFGHIQETEDLTFLT